MLLSRTLQTPAREDPSNTRCSKRLPQRLIASFVSSIVGELSSLVSTISLLLVQERMRKEVFGFVPASAEDVVGVEASSVLASTNSLLPLVVSSFGVGLLCVPLWRRCVLVLPTIVALPAAAWGCGSQLGCLSSQPPGAPPRNQHARAIRTS